MATKPAKVTAKDLLDEQMERAARTALRDWLKQEVDSEARKVANEEAQRWVATNRELIREQVNAKMLEKLPKIVANIVVQVEDTVKRSLRGY